VRKQLQGLGIGAVGVLEHHEQRVDRGQAADHLDQRLAHPLGGVGPLRVAGAPVAPRERCQQAARLLQPDRSTCARSWATRTGPSSGWSASRIAA
jgi:hypothetical protein